MPSGGARPGAGRKPGSKTRPQCHVCLERHAEPECPRCGAPAPPSDGAIAALQARALQTMGVAERMLEGNVVDYQTGEPRQAEPEVDTSLDAWLEREIPEADWLLGELLSTTSRVMIVGPTGLGKTMFGLAVAFAVAGNKSFLHWRAGRPARVLYVDGEMSRRVMKRRLGDAVRRGGKPDGLSILSREDFPNMPPLNQPQGQRWMDAFIAKHGPFDLIVFDNIQALLVGEMKEEDSWGSVLPWVKSLTRRSIGQIWFHHTGHDEGQGYGTKTREWMMDVVALMKRVEDKAADLAFTLEFAKARERDRDNRADFEPVTLRLVDDAWEAGDAPVKGGTKPNEQTMLGILADAMPNGLTTKDWYRQSPRPRNWHSPPRNPP